MSLGKDILSKCFEIENYEINRIIENETSIVLEIEGTTACFCSKCGCVGGRYDSKTQEFLIGHLNLKPVYARTKIWRMRCYAHGVVTEKHEISEGKKRHSKAVEKTIIQYTQKLDNQSVAKLFGLSKMSVYRMDFAGLSALKEPYLQEISKPKKLSVDEVSHKRRHRYATIISDYDDAKVIWLEDGRKQSDLERGFDLLGDAISDVITVTVDLWRAFENAIKEKLPGCYIVYDRFHISRLLNQAIEEERRLYQKTLADEDRKVMKKHSRWVLLKRSFNLSESNQSHLEELKKVNQTLYEIYLLKESFLSIFDSYTTKKTARKKIFSWLRDILKTEFNHLKRFARSIIKRMRNILNWFDYPISNGKAEGINNVIKTLLKQAYGYKNFEYFRLKVLQRCGQLMDYANP